MKKLALLGLTAFSLASCSKNVRHQDIKPVPYYPNAVVVEVNNHDPDSNSFPNFLKELKETECKLPNPEGKKVYMKKFFAKNKKEAEAIVYVKTKLGGLEDFDSPYVSPLELAVTGISMIRRDLSVTDGKGLVSDMYEAPLQDNENLRDSTQTAADFLMHDSGKYEGDCEDFSRTLLTFYEIMKSIAKEGDSDFHKKLYKGLQRYQIIGVDIAKHSMNASLTYNEDFTYAEISIIEPAFFDYLDEESEISEASIIMEGGLAIVSRTKKNPISLDNRLVWRLYSSEVCYELPDNMKLFLRTQKMNRDLFKEE